MITIEPPSSSDLKHAAISKAALSRFLRRVRTAVGVAGPVDVLLTDDGAIRRLNRRFRGKNRATDVLSFPVPAELAGEHGGDLAISLETAARQAAESGHSLEVEVRVLLLHGLLHLAGMDHEVDAGEMATEEQRLRVELRLPGSLIERAGSSGAATGPGLKPRSVDVRPGAAKRRAGSGGVRPTHRDEAAMHGAPRQRAPRDRAGREESGGLRPTHRDEAAMHAAPRRTDAALIGTSSKAARISASPSGARGRPALKRGKAVRA